MVYFVSVESTFIYIERISIKFHLISYRYIFNLNGQNKSFVSLWEITRQVNIFVGVIGHYMLFTYPNKEFLVFFPSFFFFQKSGVGTKPQCLWHSFHPLWKPGARLGAQPRLEPKVKSSPFSTIPEIPVLYGLLTFSFVNVKCLLHTAFVSSMKEKHQWTHWNLLS